MLEMEHELRAIGSGQAEWGLGVKGGDEEERGLRNDR